MAHKGNQAYKTKKGERFHWYKSKDRKNRLGLMEQNLQNISLLGIDT
jgi:hypothetical protein